MMRVCMAAVVLVAVLVCGGCAGAGLTGAEVELIDGSAADARFVARHWGSLSADEQGEFVRENALRWGYFSDLVHGRRPGAPAPATGQQEGGER